MKLDGNTTLEQRTETYKVVLPIRDISLSVIGITYLVVIRGMSEDQRRRYFEKVQGLAPEETEQEASFADLGGGSTQGYAEGSMRTFDAAKKFAEEEKLSFEVTELKGRAAVLAAEGAISRI